MFVQDNNCASYHKINSDALLTELTGRRQARHPGPLLLRSNAGDQRFLVTCIYASVNNKFYIVTSKLSIQWVVPRGLWSANEAITHLHLVQRFRMNGVRPILPYMPSYPGALPAHCSPRRVCAALHMAKI